MINYQLKQHQKEGVKFLAIHHYAILADAMGLGKTLQAIEIMKRTGGQTLVVCPASLKHTWAKELVKFSELTHIIFDHKKDQAWEDYEVIIGSYSQLKHLSKVFKAVDNIVGDEIHFVKNPEAKRTMTFVEYMEWFTPERFIGLTGTAIKNRVPEFYPLFYLCSLNPLETSGIDIRDKYPSYYAFARQFCHMSVFQMGGHYGRQVTTFKGHRNVEELNEIKEDKYLRRRASQVLDLPPITRKDIILTDSQIDRELLSEWNYKDNGDKKPMISRKANSAYVKAKPTVKYCKDLFDQGEGPIIVYSDHVKSAEYLHNNLKNSRLIYGATSMNHRDVIIEDFQAGKVDYLVATIGALSMGVTLTRSSNIVFNDLSFVVGDIAQCEKRIHRMSQERHCTIHNMYWGQTDFNIGKKLYEKLETLVEVL